MNDSSLKSFVFESSRKLEVEFFANRKTNAEQMALSGLKNQMEAEKSNKANSGTFD